jgi:hypothetical protein
MSRDQAYEIAVRSFHREHDRWIQNAVVLFGVLISILLTDKLSILPQSVVLVVATLFSAMTVFISLTIRGSTDAWWKTVRYIEDCRDGVDIRPFKIFRENLWQYADAHGHGRDFCKILHFWQSDVRYSVTRLYTLMAFAATLLFAGLLIFDYLMPPLAHTLYLSIFARQCDRFDMFN